MNALLFQWARLRANPRFAMPFVEDLEKEGWIRVTIHPIYTNSILMRKEENDDTRPTKDD